MREITVTITHKEGLHARPAGKFIKLTAPFASKILIYKGDEQYNGKSIISLLSACILCGQTITIQADGPDENEAIEAISAFLAEGG